MTPEENAGCNNIAVFMTGIVAVIVAFFLMLSGKEQMAYGVVVFTLPMMVCLKVALTVDDWRNE